MRTTLSTTSVSPSVVTRAEAVAAFFHQDIPTEHWQALCDHHPAADNIKADFFEAVSGCNPNSSRQHIMRAIGPLMDQLDTAGYLCSYDAETRKVSIVFTDHTERMLDTQHVVAERKRVDWVNGKDDITNPVGGWIERDYRPNRKLVWSFELELGLPAWAWHMRKVPANVVMLRHYR